MPTFLQNLFQSSYRVVNFPLFKLGKTDITLATLITFLIFCAGVIVLERLLQVPDAAGAQPHGHG